MQARGVRYRDIEGRVFEQDARVVVLAGGAIESPRLWLASGLPDTGSVGRYMTTHWFEYLSAEFPHEVDMHMGQTSMVRAEFPGYGFVESQGSGRCRTRSCRSWGGRGRNGDGNGPWKTKGRMIGSALKRKMDAYRRTLMLVAIADDEPVDSNGVRLADDLADENNPAPYVTYHGSPTTIRRREWLVDKAAEILLAAGAIPGSLHRADAAPSTIHMHGTMRMGKGPGHFCGRPGCEAHQVKRLFVADTSPFPNGIGGPNPTLTAQALATRTAAKIVERYFPWARSTSARRPGPTRRSSTRTGIRRTRRPRRNGSPTTRRSSTSSRSTPRTTPRRRRGTPRCGRNVRAGLHLQHQGVLAADAAPDTGEVAPDGRT